MTELSDQMLISGPSDAEVAAFRASGEFDEQWYLTEYPDVAKSGIDPARHYLWIGRRLGRRAAQHASATAHHFSAAPKDVKQNICSWNDLPEPKIKPGRWIQNTASIARNRARPLSPYTRSFNPNSLNIHWIIPDFGPGGGGHMSIFRLVRYLESFGHKQTIWIQNPTINNTPREAWENIRSWYQPIDRVIVRFLPDEVEGISGDLVIATDMWTVFPAAQMVLMKERFYLVQDFEALFHTHGTFSYVAEMTYHMGFKAVCAGAWLKKICEDKFGLWTRTWDLAYDAQYYYCKSAEAKLSNKPIRIAFYARASTPRRAVELGIEALNILHERGLFFQVDMFGQRDLPGNTHYTYVHHGLLTPLQLGDLYRQCDIGLVFSATNYSLIPMEMMACGLPVVELDVESTRAVFSDEAVAFSYPTPYDIANTLQRLIESEEERAKYRAGGLRFVAPLSWEKSARSLEAGLLEGMAINNEPVSPKNLFTCCEYSNKAAVIIPTWNAGARFRDVLQAITAQRTEWPFEVLIVDSGSTDETLSIIQDFDSNGVRLHQIPNCEFQHGRTRNLAISLTSAEFVAVLTQDALPANESWLSNLVKGFDLGSHVAGVFGPHYAYPDAKEFVRYGQKEHFDYYNKQPHLAHWDITPDGMEWGSVQHHQWLHFYSDNNSMMRRSVWEKIPYPEVHWSEDQMWAWEIIKQGYQKAYAHDAYVVHSHNHTEAEQFKISKIEGDLFLRFFGYRFERNPDEVQKSVEYLDRRTKELATKYSISEIDVRHQKTLNMAQVCGRYIGQWNVLKEWELLQS